MKCTVKQYCRYLCRLANAKPATITPHLETLANTPSIPKKAIIYGRRRARLSAHRSRNS